MRVFLLAASLASFAFSAAAAPVGEFVVPPPTSVATLPAGTAVQPVTLTKMVVQLREGEVWADYTVEILDKSSLTWSGGRSEMNVDVFAPIFAEELRTAGFRAEGGESLFETQGTDLQVGVLIREMRGRFCETCEILNNGAVRGAVRMVAEWQVYSSLQRTVLATIRTEGGFEIKKSREGNFERIIIGAFAENVRQLLATDAFRQIVTAPPGASPARPTLATLLLTRAKSAPTTIPAAAASVVAIFAEGGAMGSGFLISQDGYVLTNQHVVSGSKYVKVRWPDGREGLGEVVRADRRRDVALIQTDSSGRSALAMKNSETDVGDTVFAVGTPLQSTLQGTVTRGIVSAHRTTNGLSFIQSDVVINSGNSGGPLLDEKAAVTGIAVSGIDLGGAPAGINFFIPIADALRALNLQPAS